VHRALPPVAHRLGRGEAGDLLPPLVDVDAPADRVLLEDPDGRRLGDGPEPLLPGPTRLLGGAALGDVAEVQHHAADPLVLEQVGGGLLHPSPLAGRVQRPGDGDGGGTGDGEHGGEGLDQVGQVVGVGQRRAVGAQQPLGVVA